MRFLISLQALYFYQVDGRGPCLAFEGIFTFLILYSGTPPYDHPVYKTTSLLRPYSFKPNVKNIESFYYFEDPVNATTSLLRPGFYGPTVVVLTGFHCTQNVLLLQIITMSLSPLYLIIVWNDTEVHFQNSLKLHVKVARKRHFRFWVCREFWRWKMNRDWYYVLRRENEKELEFLVS